MHHDLERISRTRPLEIESQRTTDRSLRLLQKAPTTPRTFTFLSQKQLESNCEGAPSTSNNSSSNLPVNQRIMAWEERYDEKSRMCGFRSFLCSLCASEQISTQLAVHRQRMAAEGYNVPEDHWTRAQESNPDPSRLVSLPVHFFDDLIKRVQLQQEAMKNFDAQEEGLKSEANEILRAHIQQKLRLRELMEKQSESKRVTLALLGKMETIKGAQTFPRQELAYASRLQSLLQEVENTEEIDEVLHQVETQLLPSSPDTESFVEEASRPKGRSIETFLHLPELIAYLREKQDVLSSLLHTVEEDINDAKKKNIRPEK